MKFRFEAVKTGVALVLMATAVAALLDNLGLFD